MMMIESWRVKLKSQSTSADIQSLITLIDELLLSLYDEISISHETISEGAIESVNTLINELPPKAPSKEIDNRELFNNLSAISWILMLSLQEINLHKHARVITVAAGQNPNSTGSCSLLNRHVLEIPSVLADRRVIEIMLHQLDDSLTSSDSLLQFPNSQLLDFVDILSSKILPRFLFDNEILAYGMNVLIKTMNHIHVNYDQTLDDKSINCFNAIICVAVTIFTYQYPQHCARHERYLGACREFDGFDIVGPSVTIDISLTCGMLQSASKMMFKLKSNTAVKQFNPKPNMRRRLLMHDLITCHQYLCRLLARSYGYGYCLPTLQEQREGTNSNGYLTEEMKQAADKLLLLLIETYYHVLLFIADHPLSPIEGASEEFNIETAIVRGIIKHYMHTTVHMPAVWFATSTLMALLRLIRFQGVICNDDNYFYEWEVINPDIVAIGNQICHDVVSYLTDPVALTTVATTLDSYWSLVVAVLDDDNAIDKQNDLQPLLEVVRNLCTILTIILDYKLVITQQLSEYNFTSTWEKEQAYWGYIFDEREKQSIPREEDSLKLLSILMSITTRLEAIEHSMNTSLVIELKNYALQIFCNFNCLIFTSSKLFSCDHQDVIKSQLLSANVSLIKRLKDAYSFYLTRDMFAPIGGIFAWFQTMTEGKYQQLRVWWGDTIIEDLMSTWIRILAYISERRLDSSWVHSWDKDQVWICVVRLIKLRETCLSVQGDKLEKAQLHRIYDMVMKTLWLSTTICTDPNVPVQCWHILDTLYKSTLHDGKVIREWLFKTTSITDSIETTGVLLFFNTFNQQCHFHPFDVIEWFAFAFDVFVNSQEKSFIHEFRDSAMENQGVWLPMFAKLLVFLSKNETKESRCEILASETIRFMEWLDLPPELYINYPNVINSLIALWKLYCRGDCPLTHIVKVMLQLVMNSTLKGYMCEEDHNVVNIIYSSLDRNNPTQPNILPLICDLIEYLCTDSVIMQNRFIVNGLKQEVSHSHILSNALMRNYFERMCRTLWYVMKTIPNSEVENCVDCDNLEERFPGLCWRWIQFVRTCKIDQIHTVEYVLQCLCDLVERGMNKNRKFEYKVELLDVLYAEIDEYEHIDAARKDKVAYGLALAKRLRDMLERSAKSAEYDQVSEDVSDIPNEFICPITLKLMMDPVLLCDGISYERIAIERWLRSRDTSPKTNKRLASTSMFPNQALRTLISDFVSNHYHKECDFDATVDDEGMEGTRKRRKFETNEK